MIKCLRQQPSLHKCIFGFFCVLLFLNLVKYQSGKFVLPLFCLKKGSEILTSSVGTESEGKTLTHAYMYISIVRRTRLILRVGEVLGLHFVVHDLSMGRSLLLILLYRLLVQPGTRTYTHCYCCHITMKQAFLFEHNFDSLNIAEKQQNEFCRTATKDRQFP